MTVRIPLSRRRFLATAAASTAISAVVPRPYLSRAADRPVITHGIQSGDVSVDSAVIWARADRPARMLAEVATTDSFKTIHRAVFVDALPERSEEHTSELQSHLNLVCRLLLEKKKPSTCGRAINRAIS